MPIGPIIIIFESTYEEWKPNNNESMTIKLYSTILMQTHPTYPTLDATDDVVKKYYQWEHVNDVARTFILTSLTLELYEKLQDFPYASDVLDFLEVRFRKQSLIPKQNTDNKIAEVISIENEVVKLKELGLLNRG